MRLVAPLAVVRVWRVATVMAVVCRSSTVRAFAEVLVLGAGRFAVKASPDCRPHHRFTLWAFPSLLHIVASQNTHNPTVDPVRFALWTLRDEAAHRRSPTRSPSQRRPRLAGRSHSRRRAVVPLCFVSHEPAGKGRVELAGLFRRCTRSIRGRPRSQMRLPR